ncbi:MAG: hypothetical protein GXO15_04145, partial [Crenarchaeota archaeon]|nr:hypothetical protein [Thermoproteota archaeon]
LERVVPACGRCLEALQASVEAVRGRDKRLVKHLSKVNKVKKNVVEEALERIARLHALLSEAESWSVRLEALRGAPPRGRRALEILLEMIASGEIAVDSGRVYAEVLDSEEVRVTVEESVERLCGSPTLASSLAHLASEEGLAPSWAALEGLVERLRPRVCRSRATPARLVPLLRGAWELRLPPRVGARLFAALVSRVNSPREPSWVHRVETVLRRPAVVWVYAPSSLDPGIAARVLREALELLPPGVEPLEPPVYRHGGPGGPVLYRAAATTMRL